jgi:hypothetical protein
MGSLECHLGLGLLLGVLIGVLLVQGNIRRKAAVAKIQAFPKEKEKANDIVKKAEQKRKEGLSELPGALLLLLLGLTLLILAAYLLTGGQGF